VLNFLARPAAAVPADVQALADERAAARKAKNWAESDRLRNAIAALGWTVKDTKDGQRISKAN
ncbi:MAG: cysteine--tRNA ligase, partial [Kiritimatiellae bacterium]|nr:cysteine--tRNA ligase [Kiritimatiellia bacterium]